MSNASAVQLHPPTAKTASGTGKRLLQITGGITWWSALLFPSAGRLDWVRGWISVAFWLAGMIAFILIVSHYNPTLLAARQKWRHKDTKRFDKIFLAAFFPLAVIQPVLAGLDAVRYRWSSMPFGFVYPGAILFVLGVALIAWAMAVNPFAESTVRIQTDRGHCVITSGPYGTVRHPMYAGFFLMCLGLPLIWGSVWALAVSGVIAVEFIWRTALEDQTLRRELSGYAEYAARTRYRILPGVW
jgi:protein-S-isoprenylcysteine O-methyltransferase Ste14